MNCSHASCRLPHPSGYIMPAPSKPSQSSRARAAGGPVRAAGGISLVSAPAPVYAATQRPLACTHSILQLVWGVVLQWLKGHLKNHWATEAAQAPSSRNVPWCSKQPSHTSGYWPGLNPACPTLPASQNLIVLLLQGDLINLNGVFEKLLGFGGPQTYANLRVGIMPLTGVTSTACILVSACVNWDSKHPSHGL